MDHWRNQAALDAHHALPMMQELAALRAKHDLHMKVERYLMDKQGMLSADRKFIRR
nr:hypothetical protein [uncultured Limosilactobacillus sp.]